LEGIVQMELRWRNLFLVSTFVALALAIVPCNAQRRDRVERPQHDQNESSNDDIWAEDGPRGPRRPPLSDEIIDRVLEEIKKDNPAKARELSELRKKDAEKFRTELLEQGREYFRKIFREQWEEGRRKAMEEFLTWLSKEYPEEAKELDKFRDHDPELYNKKYEIASRKYRQIYDAWRRNPELGQILKEDYSLRERRDDLIEKIKNERSRSKREKLEDELETVVAGRFDLIVRRKQISYQELVKRLQELQKLIEEGRSELIQAQDPAYKQENVQERMRDLLRRSDRRFGW